MAYTPIGWQTGDTITAEKMNKMDNGWGVFSTQLFNGSVTVDSGGDAETTINPAAFSATTDAIITVNGTTYNCVGFDDNGYWTFGSPYDAPSEYPFSFYRSGDTVYFMAKVTGSYTLDFIAVGYEVGTSFETVVKMIASSLLPLKIVIGSTTWQEVYDAMSAGRIAFVGSGTAMEFVSRLTEYSIFCIAASGSNVVQTTYYASDANSPFFPD
ncbi:MAG: hypothetical protein IJH43_07065 [Mogibacterium sp.]|nr:hypothetical protein [Mogibacterium sp.]